MRKIQILTAVVAMVLTGSVALGADNSKTKKPHPPIKVPDVKQIGGMMFKILDKNKDGKISKAELATFLKTKGKLTTGVEKMVDQLDADKDGMLSKEEFVKAGPKLKALLGMKFPDLAKKVADVLKSKLKGKVGGAVKKVGEKLKSKVGNEAKKIGKGLLDKIIK